MGKHKTQRTEALMQAARRCLIAEEVSNRIEQHNFDRLVRQGVLVDMDRKNRLLNSEGRGRRRRGFDGL